jgi:hypothetical protein
VPIRDVLFFLLDPAGMLPFQYCGCQGPPKPGLLAAQLLDPSQFARLHPLEKIPNDIGRLVEQRNRRRQRINADVAMPLRGPFFGHRACALLMLPGTSEEKKNGLGVAPGPLAHLFQLA